MIVQFDNWKVASGWFRGGQVICMMDFAYHAMTTQRPRSQSACQLTLATGYLGYLGSSRLQFISKDKSLVFLYIQLRHRHILLVYDCLPAGAKHRVREATRAREASSCEATSLRNRQGARSAVSIPHCCASRGSVAYFVHNHTSAGSQCI